MRDDLVGGRLAAEPLVRVAIAVEQVARERHLLAERAAEQVAGADAELLAGDVHAGELDRGVELRAVVVERGHRVHDLPAELLELQRIVADEIRLEPRDRGLRRLRRRRPSRPTPVSPSSVSISTMVRTNRPQCAPLEWRSGASSGIVTVVARRSVIFMTVRFFSSFRWRAAEREQQAAVDDQRRAGDERGARRG